MQRNSAVNFVLALFVINTLVFGLHVWGLYLLDLPYWGSLKVEAYLVNMFLALIIGFGLYKLRFKFTDSLGFLFLGGTALKFVVFFVFFQPYYKANGDLSILEFTSFFIPYAINLIIETTFLVRVLNKAS